MKVGYFQFAPVLRNPERNRRAMERALGACDADLVVLPELSNSGYNFSTRADLAVSAESGADGPTIRLWHRIAAKRGMVIVGGFAERDGKRFFNSAAFVTPSGKVHVYRKAHLFGKEGDFFEPGSSPPPVFSVAGVRLGVMICFDWAFPEFARILALNRAQIICHPSNIVTTFAHRGMLVRSVENRVFTITANRTGVETGRAGRLRFPGRSQVIGPRGEVLVSSGETAVECRVVKINPHLADDKRLAGVIDMFASRRPGLYGDLVRASKTRG